MALAHFDNGYTLSGNWLDCLKLLWNIAPLSIKLSSKITTDELLRQCLCVYIYMFGVCFFGEYRFNSTFQKHTTLLCVSPMENFISAIKTRQIYERSESKNNISGICIQRLYFLLLIIKCSHNKTCLYNEFFILKPNRISSDKKYSSNYVNCSNIRLCLENFSKSKN